MLNMNSLFRNVYDSSVMWSLYKKSIQNDLCVPCYHVVNDDPSPHLRNLFPIIATNKFEKDIDFLSRKFDFISPNELLVYLNKNEIPKNKCILTFDDGYRECYDIIYPILKSKGIPAIFCITSDFVENEHLSHFNKISLILDKLNENTTISLVILLLKQNNLYSGNVYRDIRKLEFGDLGLIENLGKLMKIDFEYYLNKNKPYLNKIQIKELHSNGFGIGAHSKNHQRNTELNSEQQKLQTKLSLEFVESIIEEQVSFFAFPYSSSGFKPELYKEFSNIIFFDTFKGFVKSHSRIIQRFTMDTNRSIASRLIEIRLKKISYDVRFKNLPQPSLLEY